MMLLQVISSLRNLIPQQIHLFREIKPQTDAKPKRMICISPIHKKYYQKHLQNLLMDLPSYKDLFGKTTHVFNLSREQKIKVQFN